MVSLHLLILLVAALIILCWSRYIALRRNIIIAQKINLPYVLLPFYAGGLIWVVSYTVVAPILKYCLPSSIHQNWIEFCFVYWTWSLGYSPFQQLGSDTILTVSPGGIAFFTCSPEIIAQVGSRHKDFLKPTSLYKIIDAFGPNLVSSNGTAWRRQRKSIAPSFNEANNSLVWTESIFQTKCMLKRWSSHSSLKPKHSLLNIQDDLKTVAFHILNRAGFGVRLWWPGSRSNFEEVDDGGMTMDGNQLEVGHEMRFGEAMLIVVDHLKELFIFPKWVLKHAPSKSLNRIWLAHKKIDCYLGKYISSQQCSSQRSSNHTNPSTNIRSSLIANTLRRTTTANSHGALTKEEIIGNCFTALVAGHETSGSTLFLAIISLALSPSWQKRMQLDIDKLFGGQDPSYWSYSENVGKLFGSCIDAVICETLRLYPPANIIPKHTAPGYTHILRYGNREIHVPGDTTFNILTASTHRNPTYWPYLPSSYHSGNDLDEFKPGRWFTSYPEESHKCDSGIDLGTDQEDCPNEKFFTPKRGSFIPFSLGQRECVGKRFAQIEMLVVLAVIFRDWSVELAVDREEECMTGEQWREAWEQVREAAREHLKSGMEHYMTMQLTKGLIPLRIVKRGSERVY